MDEIRSEVIGMPLIASSIMEYDDLQKAKDCGASAYSFGTIVLPTKWWRLWELFTRPCLPTAIVERHMAARGKAVLAEKNKK